MVDCGRIEVRNNLGQSYMVIECLEKKLDALSNLVYVELVLIVFSNQKSLFFDMVLALWM